MTTTPERCPTCDTVVPEGASRCPGCGRVFGEANRCPSCNAVAAVIRKGNTTVCAACGKPRAGTVVLGGGGAGGAIVPSSVSGREASTSAMVTRARGRGQRGFGILALGGGVFLAVLAAALVPGSLGIGLAVVGGLLGVGLGALSIRAGARNMQQAEADDERAKQTAVLELAANAGGRLTATDVAQRFKVTPDEADRLLTRMVGDGSRVDVDVDDEGVVRYVFRELVARGARVRVEVADEPEDELEASGDSAAEREARRRAD